MLSIKEIEQHYPEHLRPFKSFLMREFLQYKILEIIFNSPYANKLCFLGGTCLRIIHNQQRFSEDLDFDNFNLQEDEFDAIAKHIAKELKKNGYVTEIKTVHRGAFHCYIKFPNLLFNEDLSGYRNEKILIQLDTEAQHFKFTPEQRFLNKFDVFTSVFTTPLDILLAQKCYAVLNRKRNKGRDFFDIVFLLGKDVKPNYDFLFQKMKIENASELKKQVLARCSAIDMKEMAKDVAPFLIQADDVKKIWHFEAYFRDVAL